MLKKFFALLFIAAAFGFVAFNARTMSAAAADAPTFSNEVVRIFQRNCQVCHHAGDIAPFSLMSYQEARPYASRIKEKTASREMPPWKPVPGCGEFEGERRLTDEEIDTVARWVNAGAPEGNSSDLPEPLRFDGGWTIGQPDLVLQPDADYTVKPGNDVYRCFSIPTDLRGDRYVSAVEIKPGNREVVHHVIIYLDTTGESKRLDDADPEPGYTSFGGPGFAATGTLGGWAPGARARYEPDGNGWLLPKDARVVIQVHYHPHTADSETDRTQIGLYFARKPIVKDIQVLPLINTNFSIPAGDPHYRVTALAIIPPGANAHILGIAPHMHLLGREMNVEARLPNGTTECLINIDDWDFHWQGVYYYKEPVAITPFTQLSLTAYYDNSVNNPRNPNYPPKTVTWGEQTTDEMCIAFFLFTLDGLNHTPSLPQLNDVSVDTNGRLIVSGRGFSAGADILIDGERVRDTVNHKKKKKAEKQLISKEDWQRLAPPGKQVMVSVLNTDGVTTATLSFMR
ncbi:MAG TPA: ascorbate-dependent monooxygenase [Blastocatellia bacterium]|nr:ascorbate-dependent monooxygenase [Blastocatellia bacterium]